MVRKALEEAKRAGTVPNPLEAAVTVYAGPRQMELLESLGKSLRFALIVSQVALGPLEQAPAEAIGNSLAKVTVACAEGHKCERCWLVEPDVGTDPEHPSICARCAEAVRMQAGVA